MGNDLNGDENKPGTDESPGNSSFDFARAESEISGDEETNQDKPKAVSGELITADETQKRASRAVVFLIELVFKVKHSGIKYGENVYEQAEEELGPVIGKHRMAGRGLFNYFEELLALKFIFGTVFESIRWIRAERETETKEKADDAKQEHQKTQ
ncbi:MAG: hypothetical protein COB04_18375 [Gammaproteobacteria bacterium]|nr:MAG: hypothetical protein COB04_18375 [Gammaproteobacteria bacterium]